MEAEFEPPGLAKIFFSDKQSVTLNYHTPRHIQNENTLKLISFVVLFHLNDIVVADRLWLPGDQVSFLLSHWTLPDGYTFPKCDLTETEHTREQNHLR